MKNLTKAEEEVMQHLWDLKKAFVKEIIKKMPEPKPAYNTVSTIIRILEKKGFVDHDSFGNTHRYYPLVSKDEYSDHAVKSVLKKYFSNSFEEMLSFFAKKEDLSIREVEELLNELKKKRS